MHLKFTAIGCAVFVVATLGACGNMSRSQSSGFATLDGQQPLVVAHRGASGYLPEETLEAYALAIELGADVIEMDLLVTKDGVLVARHDPNLAISTDIAKHPEFASRRKTMQVDGETQTGWFVQDFTLAEIKTLGGISTDAERPQQFNGQFKIPTFQEIIDFAKAKAKTKETGRTIAIYPETKNPAWFRDMGLPMEDKLVAMVDAAGWNSKAAPVYVQSFEPGSLKYMKSKGLNTRLVQLIGGDGIEMVTPAGLAEIKTYADGIGPWKRYIFRIQGANEASATTMAPSTLVADAHKAGLFVHPFTFRNERRRLAADYKGDPKNEYLAYYRLGVDGVFTDFTDTALAARAIYLKEIGR